MKAEQNKILMLLVIVSVLGAYKFYEVGKSAEYHRTIASMETSQVTPEEIAENQLDLELLSLQHTLGGDKIKKCYENRLSCGSIRNHSKCLSDKVSHFLNCANIDRTQIAHLKKKLPL